MKKKILITIIIVLLIIFSSIIIFNIKQKNDIQKIKDKYNNYIITNKETNIYNNEHSIIGTAKEGTYFELDNINIKSKKDIYFKIKNTDYYLYYKDIEKTEQKIEENKKEYYLNIGKQITTNETTNFYQNNKLNFTINNSLTFDADYIDENYYYITYLNQTYQIKNDEATSNDIEINGIATYISVLNYNSIEEKCNIENCVTNENFKNQLNNLKEEGFYTINIDDYKLWLKGYINLKEKAILITSKQDIDSIAAEYGFTIEHNFEDLTYTESNSKSEKGNTTIPRYNIINKTTIDIFKKITNGESIVYQTVKPTQTHTLPNKSENATKIAVLNYHFFYDPTIGETCPDGNCKKVQDFENELAYLKENNYKTLTMDEFTKWMYGEIELPARSVLITIDDGAMGTGKHNGNKLNPLLEKYQTHATLFLITGWWDINNYKSDYLDIESHTHDMHEGNYCSNVQRGSKLLCSSKEAVYNDLNTSASITGSKKAFCFPMYVYNDTTMEVLKELDFKLAFIGGDTKATRNNNKYKIPRYHIYRDTTLDQFINMIS